MNLNEFQSQQQGLLSNPQQLGGMAANNLRQLMPAVNSLPSAPPAANMG